jgi:hypothetical protein
MMLLGAVAVTPARASDKQDFERCDGLVHPGKQADGMRGAADSPRFASLLGSPTADVEACTRALASPRLLATQTIRRAHLLRARAVARLRAGDAGEAVKDLDLAETALGGAAADPFMKRSMGVSITLLRSLSLARSGDMAGAVPLARRRRRPALFAARAAGRGQHPATRPADRRPVAITLGDRQPARSRCGDRRADQGGGGRQFRGRAGLAADGAR